MDAEEKRIEAESKRIEVDGETYQLRPWFEAEGAKWQAIILDHILALDPSDTNQMGAVQQVLRPFVRDHFLSLWETCKQYTDVVSMAEGRETVVPLSKVAAQHMKRKHNARIMIMRQHLEVEFGDFLARGLRDAFQGVEQAVTAM